MDFINTLLILISITGLGMLSRHYSIFLERDKIVLNSFIYRFALPALLIDTLSSLAFSRIEIEIVIGSVVPVLASLLLIFLIYVFRWITKAQMIIASITLAFGSNAFFGIAFFDALYGAKAMEFAILSAGILGILGIVVAVCMFEFARHGNVKLATLGHVLFNPPVAAIFVGILLALFDVELLFFEKASALLGKTAGGLAIFVLGMFIYDVYSTSLIKKALPYVLLRIFLLPVITYLTLLMLPNLSDELYAYLFQQSGIPAAISIAILAQRYEYYEKELSAIVMLSSLLSFGVLSLLYIFTQSL